MEPGNSEPCAAGPPSSGPQPGPAQLGGVGGRGKGTTDCGISLEALRGVTLTPAELGEPRGRGLRGANPVGRGQCPSPTCSSEAYFKEHQAQRRGPASLPSPTSAIGQRWPLKCFDDEPGLG